MKQPTLRLKGMLATFKNSIRYQKTTHYAIVITFSKELSFLLRDEAIYMRICVEATCVSMAV